MSNELNIGLNQWVNNGSDALTQCCSNQSMLGYNIHPDIINLNNTGTNKTHHLFRINDMCSNTQSTRQGSDITAVSMSQPRLHILLVTETWLPDVNGVAMSLHQIMRQLVMMGHQVSLIRPKPKQHLNADYSRSNIKSEDIDNGAAGRQGEKIDSTSSILTYDIQVKGIPIPKYPDLQIGMPVYKQIKKELQQLQPDIVHIATEGPLGLAALYAAKNKKIAVTTGYHTQFHDFSRHFGFGIIARPLMAYFRWMHNASHATCVPSQKTQDDLDQLGFKRVVQVGRGVDLKRFNPEHRSEALRETWGAKKQDTVLVMVSRLSPEKGVDIVIKSFKALQSAQLHRAVKLVIVGDGPDRGRLQSLALNSEDIIFTGSKKGHELAQHYASGDAFVFASQVETFGNVVTEAMASGLPVYAFDDAAASMLVTPTSGGLVEVGDKPAFIDMVAKLPKMQVLKEQGIEASKQVAGFSWQRPAKQMLEMFNNAIQLKGKAINH